MWHQVSSSFMVQVSELISKLEDERNQLQEQLETAATREAEVLQQVGILFPAVVQLSSSVL